MTGAGPLVSVVTATYNRSAWLDLSMRSLVGQTLEDWEQWVIGDACTDDTAEVVEALGDARIRYFNLPENCGEQSGPNNEGVRRARGRYIAFLNHDDMWFPDHLEKAVERLERGGTDLVFTVGAGVDPGGGVRLLSVTPTGRCDEYAFVPASCWVFRREAFDVVGPWRNFRRCWLVPSQDWLFRGGRAGLRTELLPELTVVILPSGLRMGSYVSDDHGEYREAFGRLADPVVFRTELLTRAAVASAARAAMPVSVRRHAVRAAKDAVRRGSVAAGISPYHVVAVLRHPRKGGIVDDLRKVRGLPRR